MSPTVSIIIPTFRRPDRAIEAARSALAQACDASFELVLVDNDPVGSALEPLRALSDQRVVVIHEPCAGIANARNAGLRAARGEIIAFLDDDEIAPSDWLTELLRVQREGRADVVFGPVRTKLAAKPRAHEAYFSAFFAREPDHAEGVIDIFYGCGCSLVRRSALPSAEPFSIERNEIGGEDDLLFQAMEAAGARFAWAPNAFVWETPEPSRVTLAYTLRRAFAYGQGPATKAWTGPKRDLSAIAFWMAIGAGQTVVYGAVAFGCFLAKTEGRAFAYRRFVEGLGKVLWFPAIKPRFYGAAKLTKSERAAEAQAVLAA
ncbi:MAG: glycosyltransferase family 2 protein [Hyphomonadaceae bacterium]|nr:glycosyltransferase family 2 protein [Hyphomonadaceae bacterium]